MWIRLFVTRGATEYRVHQIYEVSGGISQPKRYHYSLRPYLVEKTVLGISSSRNLI
jgi:hypothetical protein